MHKQMMMQEWVSMKKIESGTWKTHHVISIAISSFAIGMSVAVIITKLIQ